MKEEWFLKRRIILLPIGLFVIFAIAYFVTQTYFVQCKGNQGDVLAGCEAGTCEYVFSPRRTATSKRSASGDDINVNDIASRQKNAERFGGVIRGCFLSWRTPW